MLLYPKLQLIPHPDAPLFNGEDALLILRQALQEAASGRFSTSNESLRQLFRQAGFVNLWFFGKIIAGYSGPFSEWTSHLHMDMANFRQSLLEPGCRGAMYIPRSHFKDLDINLPVLTSNRGWQKHGDLRIGDYVFSPEGKPVKVIGVSERFFKPCLKLTFSDGAKVITGKTHLWRRVNHNKEDDTFYEIVKAEDLELEDDIGVLQKHIHADKIYSPIHAYRLVKKIEETLPVETSCIMVEGGMYVVGKQFIPTHNTSVVTEAGGAWEILRNPEIRVRITHAIADTAQGFMHTIKAIFDSNEIVRWLYPEYVPKSQKGERWNDTELVLPNRRKKLREANIEYGGVGGASEGHHFDLHIIDDMIGLNALNAARQSNAEMIRGVNWFWSSEKSLLQSMKTSRVIVVGTRYSVDDVYSQIIDRAYEFVGYPMDGVEPNPKGQWKVYYRKGIEDGEVIFPENFTIEAYNQLAEDDWWSYVTQFMNDPQQTGLAELSEYSLNKCWLRWEEDKKMWFILWKDRNEDDIIGLVEEPITNFDVIQAVDPAATEKYISAKTSRSAVGVLATHWSGKKFLISLNADYVSPLTMFDWMFANKRKFGPWLRGTFLEANAGFKVLHPILNKEESERNSYLNLRSYPAVGDKTARIRSDLQPEFKKSNLYVCEEVFSLVEEERKAFPQSMKKDILDMLSSAVRNSIQPLSPKDMIRRERLEEAWRNRRTSNVTGY